MGARMVMTWLTRLTWLKCEVLLRSWQSWKSLCMAGSAWVGLGGGLITNRAPALLRRDFCVFRAPGGPGACNMRFNWDLLKATGAESTATKRGVC
jgi:hypothetical protein